MTNSAIEAILEPATTDIIDLGVDTRPSNNVVVIKLSIASSITRIASGFVAKAGIKVDDWLMVPTLVSNFILRRMPGPRCGFLDELSRKVFPGAARLLGFETAMRSTAIIALSSSVMGRTQL